MPIYDATNNQQDSFMASSDSEVIFSRKSIRGWKQEEAEKTGTRRKKNNMKKEHW